MLASGELLLAQFGGGGENTGLVCGYLACDGELIKPALAALPRVLRVNLREDASGEWLENTLRHAMEQAAAGAPGSDVITAHLAEVLFAEVLRRYLLRLPRAAPAGSPARAIRRWAAPWPRCTGGPPIDWTLESLAKEAGISRSVLTERFTRYLGQGPMGYLADWRLDLAPKPCAPPGAACSAWRTMSVTNPRRRSTGHSSGKFSLPPARYRRQWRESEFSRDRRTAAPWRWSRRDGLHGFAARGGDRARHVGQIRRLVAARLRSGLDVARQQIGRVAFDHQPVGGDAFDDLAQMQAAALVVDPAGDADVQAELEIGIAFLFAGREAVRDARCSRDARAGWR